MQNVRQTHLANVATEAGLAYACEAAYVVYALCLVQTFVRGTVIFVRLAAIPAVPLGTGTHETGNGIDAYATVDTRFICAIVDVLFTPGTHESLRTLAPVLAD